ncbi:uncharacterized protein LOC110431679 [Sorghum bicolor]|uniref:uncharacterized protein LOC110431679 n=1 Tax=Sorghum bicolor TaxID=4558 RepID=UPI000B4247F9|nr:uncharacterized protein LOC110431679 [Sorghum bicolor]|eukprot:XP_021306677.1 uncharacterized protein LOC110431679 [Sorghum bicolor]
MVAGGRLLAARFGRLRALAITAITRRSSCTAAAVSAPTLPAAGARSRSDGVLLLTACLPVVFTEHQPSQRVRDFLRLESLLEHPQSPDHLLDGDPVQVEEHLEGDGGLRELLWNNLQELFDYLYILDVVAEGAQVGCECGDADAEVADGFPLLEGESAELPAELLRAGVARALIADPQMLDRILGLLHRVLPGQRVPELGRHRA